MEWGIEKLRGHSVGQEAGSDNSGDGAGGSGAADDSSQSRGEIGARGGGNAEDFVLGVATICLGFVLLVLMRRGNPGQQH